METRATNDSTAPTPAIAEFDRPIVTGEKLKTEVFNTLREKGVPVNRIRYGLGHLVIKVMRKSNMISNDTTPNDVEIAATHVLKHLQLNKERQ